MKKFDRLAAIVMALQLRQETAQSLAGKLEVSKRTILRDMQSLSEMGVPICAIPGPAGGYSLMDGYKLPPLHLNEDEALAIMFALHAVTKMADSPFNQARWTALDKIRMSLPDYTIRKIEPILGRMEMDIPNRRYKLPHLQELLDHTSFARWIRVHYRSANHIRWLELLPHRVYAAHGFWYCEAYSAGHEEQRTFRIDRMMEIEPLTNPPDIAAHSSSAVVQHKQDEKVRIIAQFTYRGALLAEQDPHIGHYIQHINDEVWRIDFMFPLAEWNWLVNFFYELGVEAVVLEPQVLQEEVKRKAAQVFNHYENLNVSEE